MSGRGSPTIQANLKVFTRGNCFGKWFHAKTANECPLDLDGKKLEQSLEKT
jgi:hypothetical protein